MIRSRKSDLDAILHRSFCLCIRDRVKSTSMYNFLTFDILKLFIDGFHLLKSCFLSYQLPPYYTLPVLYFMLQYPDLVCCETLIDNYCVFDITIFYLGI